MLNEMVVFAQVVESGSFSVAARQLGLSTSAVSRHVSRLEAHLKGRLLQRTTRSFGMTELGERVNAGCLQMLSSARQVHTLAGSYAARPNGKIRVSAPVVFGQNWLAAKLPRFLTQFPEVDVELTLVDRIVDLIDDGVDLAIRVSNTLPPGLVAQKLCDVHFILVASHKYVEDYGVPASPAVLSTHKCIYLGYESFDADWAMVRDRKKVTVRIPTRLTINNSAAIIAAVKANGGIGLVPDFAALPSLMNNEIVQVLPEWKFDRPYSSVAYAVYTPGPHLAQKVRVLIDFLKRDIASQKIRHERHVPDEGAIDTVPPPCNR